MNSILVSQLFLEIPMPNKILTKCFVADTKQLKDGQTDGWMGVV
jgi:hypothetical protein